MLNRVLNYLYHLSVFVIIALPFALLFRHFRVKALKKRGVEMSANHEIVLILFLCYAAGLYGLTTGRIDFGGELRFNLIPFRFVYDLLFGCYAEDMKTAVINIAGNVIMFIPIGFFTALLWQKPSLLKSAAVTAAFSLVIELMQLVMPARVTDADDLIMNTIGGMIGYVVYAVLAKAYPKYKTDFISDKLSP